MSGFGAGGRGAKEMVKLILCYFFSKRSLKKKKKQIHLGCATAQETEPVGNNQKNNSKSNLIVMVEWK